MSHPSSLALDRYALEPRPGELADHVAGCASCRAHLAAVAATLPVPEWVHAARAPRRWHLPWLGAVAAAAVSLALAVIVWPRPDPLTRVKGIPSLKVWVKRGDRVQAFGAEALAPGDAIQLEVASGGFTHLLVADLADGTPHVLFASRLDPTRPASVTPAWRVDAHGGQEHLTVVLTRHPVSDRELPSLMGRHDAQAWTLDALLPKETP